MNTDIRILSPCGHAGVRIPEQSFMNGMELSCTASLLMRDLRMGDRISWAPGVSIVSKRAVKKDLDIMITNGLSRKIPIIIGLGRRLGSSDPCELDARYH
ncbi:hypothetical protein [Paenibacillus glucanolyticus]|uniref:hypothetical protein n=1 Tax=Paenibacillus glucanolyticus TaxID=59843 RepID=UPI00390842CB